MDFNGINLPDLTPRIDTSFIDEMNRRNQEMIDSITPLNEILAEEIKPILEGNQKVVEGLNDNYSKLNDLYLLKEKELEEVLDPYLMTEVGEERKEDEVRRKALSLIHI